MGFNKRKWWHFGKNYRKSITIEIAGWKSHPSIYFRADGGEGDITFHIALGFGIWITFAGFIPNKWYPRYYSTYTKNKLPEERELSISIHGGCLWWDFWVSENWSSYTKNKTWRKGNIDFRRLIMGKHKCEWKEIERRQFMLPFLEGNYNVEVIKSYRFDIWQRWPMKKTISYEVIAGYYENGEFIAKPVPVEGKGENSWDCDEDATYSCYFPGPPYRKENKTCFDAALYFWHSMMKSRERYGSAQWIPQAFKDKKIEFIKK